MAGTTPQGVCPSARRLTTWSTGPAPASGAARCRYRRTSSISRSVSEAHEKVWEFDECGYAFVVENLSYNFSTVDLRGLESRETVPVVLDWAVGNLPCREAKENNNVTAFACRASKSDCVDSSNGSGYRCKCMDGFEGNPYLLQGCQGI